MIERPVELDEGRYGDEPLRIRLPNGVCMFESFEVTLEDAREIVDIINDYEDLEARLSAVRAERDEARAERDEARAQRDACAAEAGALREALRRAVDFIGDVGRRVDEVLGEDGWSVYAASPSAWVALAAARARVCRAAARAEGAGWNYDQGDDALKPQWDKARRLLVDRLDDLSAAEAAAERAGKK